MTQKDVIDVLSNFMFSAQGGAILGGAKDHIDKTIRIVLDGIKMLEDNQEVKPNKEVFELVTSSLGILRNITERTPFDDNYVSFVKGFTLLITNFNQHVLKNDQIGGDARFLSRYVELQLTTVELLKAAKAMVAKVDTMKNYGMPAIELSKHYLESLDKEISKDKQQTIADRPVAQEEEKNDCNSCPSEEMCTIDGLNFDKTAHTN